jgi:hypothetical protein
VHFEFPHREFRKPCLISTHKPKISFCVYLLDHNPKLWVQMNISKKITRKVPSSGARFWETSRKGSLGFEYLSSWKYKNSSTYLGTIITSLLQDEQCLDEQCLIKKEEKKVYYLELNRAATTVPKFGARAPFRRLDATRWSSKGTADIARSTPAMSSSVERWPLLC